MFCLSRSLEVGSYLHWFSSQGFQGQYLCFLAFPGHLQIATEEKEAVRQLPHIAYGKECADGNLTARQEIQAKKKEEETEGQMGHRCHLQVPKGLPYERKLTVETNQ